MDIEAPPAYERGIAATGLRRCCVETVRTSDDRLWEGEQIRCDSCDTWLRINSYGLWERGRAR